MSLTPDEIQEALWAATIAKSQRREQAIQRQKDEEAFNRHVEAVEWMRNWNEWSTTTAMCYGGEWERINA